MNEDECVERAIKAYHRMCNARGWIYQQPSNASQATERKDGVVVVELMNCNGPLGTYEYNPKTNRYKWAESAAT